MTYHLTYGFNDKVQEETNDLPFTDIIDFKSSLFLYCNQSPKVKSVLEKMHDTNSDRVVLLCLFVDLNQNFIANFIVNLIPMNPLTNNF